MCGISPPNITCHSRLISATTRSRFKPVVVHVCQFAASLQGNIRGEVTYKGRELIYGFAEVDKMYPASVWPLNPSLRHIHRPTCEKGRKLAPGCQVWASVRANSFDFDHEFPYFATRYLAISEVGDVQKCWSR
jgi:hypothetical protein